jgi:hypothetical protein
MHKSREPIAEGQDCARIKTAWQQLPEIKSKIILISPPEIPHRKRITKFVFPIFEIKTGSRFGLPVCATDFFIAALV